MHHSSKTSRLANLVLAFGLTIVTLFSAAPSDGAARPSPEATPAAELCALSLAVTGPLAGAAQAVASVAQPAVCDRCRAICARSCSSYACVACAKSIQCRQTVQACVVVRRKA